METLVVCRLFKRGIFLEYVYTIKLVAYNLYARTKSWNYNLNHEYGFNVWGYILGWFNIFIGYIN